MLQIDTVNMKMLMQPYLKMNGDFFNWGTTTHL